MTEGSFFGDYPTFLQMGANRSRLVIDKTNGAYRATLVELVNTTGELISGNTRSYAMAA